MLSSTTTQTLSSPHCISYYGIFLQTSVSNLILGLCCLKVVPPKCLQDKNSEQNKLLKWCASLCHFCFLSYYGFHHVFSRYVSNLKFYKCPDPTRPVQAALKSPNVQSPFALVLIASLVYSANLAPTE